MKNIISILTLVMLFACIKPFNPAIESTVENKYVVSGKITDTEGWQEVNISLSSPIEIPIYTPIAGCQVTIKDDIGNSFQLEEYNSGSYRIWLGEEYLIPGTAYMVRVQTPSGEIIESTYDTMQEGPHLDSVYYEIEDLPTSNPDEFLRGIQYYVDLHAESVECRNYKWEIDHTYETHAANAKEYYYDGGWHQIDPPDSSTYVCWTTSLVKNVYTLSTEDLSQNTHIKYPLHFVDVHQPNLAILYSILVKQLAI